MLIKRDFERRDRIRFDSIGREIERERERREEKSRWGAYFGIDLIVSNNTHHQYNIDIED